MLKKFTYVLFILLISCVLLEITFGAFTYFYLIKNVKHAYSIDVYKSHHDLGIALQKNTKGRTFDFLGTEIPFYTNSLGCRINETKPNYNTTNVDYLFLGDSFTEGVDSAKYVYPFVFSELSNKSLLNAGQSAASYAQMLILSDSILSKVKPQKVVVQVSPWLNRRSVLGKFNFGFFYIPAPYFYGDNTEISIYPAKFEVNLIDFKDSKALNNIRNTKASVSEFSKFILVDWLPNINNYFFELLHRFFAIRPRIYKDYIEDTRILQLFKNRTDKLGIDLVLLQIGYNYTEEDDNEETLKLKNWANKNGVSYVDADYELWMQVPKLNQHNYDMLFAHTIGNPPKVYDPHPNPTANRVIAQTLVNKLEP